MSILIVTVSLMCLLKPKLGIYLFFICIFFPITMIEDMFSITIHAPKILPYFILMSACLGIFLWSGLKIKTNFFYNIRPLTRNVLIIYILIVIIANILNDKNIITTLFSLRWLITLLCITYLMNTYFTENDLKPILKILVIIGILQIPLVLFQRFYLVIMMNDPGDSVTGTFPQFHELIFYQLFLIGVLLNSYHMRVRLFNNINPFVIIYMLIFTMILSNSKAAFVFLIIFILFSLSEKFNLRIFFKYITVLFPILVGGLFIFDYIIRINYGAQDSNFTYLFNSDYILGYLTRGIDSPNFIFGNDLANSEFGRIGNILFNLKAIGESLSTILFGLGGTLYMESSASSSTEIPYILHSTIARSIGISGFLGTICILLFIFSFRKYKYISNSSLNRLKNIISRITFLFLLLGCAYYNNLQSFYTSLIISLSFLGPNEKKV